MSEFDPTLSELQTIQDLFDIENDTAGDKYNDPVLHVSWHLNRLNSKVTDPYERYDHIGETELDVSIIDREVIPDLLVLAAMLARARGVKLSEAYQARLHSLEQRNETHGSADRALEIAQKYAGY